MAVDIVMKFLNMRQSFIEQLLLSWNCLNLMLMFLYFVLMLKETNFKVLGNSFFCFL